MWERYKLEHAHVDRYNDPTGWNWYDILILFIIDFMTLVFSDLHVGLLRASNWHYTLA